MKKALFSLITIMMLSTFSTKAQVMKIYKGESLLYVLSKEQADKVVFEDNYGEYFYEIGNESNWETSHALYGPNYDGKYTGYYYLNGEFKFKPIADKWDDDLEYNGEGMVADIPGGPNCPDPGAGLYQIDLDVAAGTYALTPISSLTLIGSAVPGDAWITDSDPFVWDSSLNAFTLTYTVKDGEYKIRANRTWDISWGSGPSGLTTYCGANMSITAGTYKFVFTPACDGKATLTITIL